MLPPRAEEVRRLVIAALERSVGDERWDRLVGPVVGISAITASQGNWTIEPTGSERQRHAIERAVKLVQMHHQFILMS